MDINAAERIWAVIDQTSLTWLKEDVIEKAVRYARTRVDWQLADTETRANMESDRTLLHNALITSLDILARNMAQRGEDDTWRKSLGADRKIIGDFACCVHCLLGLWAR